MATKKNTTVVETAGIEKKEYVAPTNDIPVKNEDVPISATVSNVESKIWNAVENSADVTTLAMNLPTGVLIAVFANDIGTMQYVAGIHYDAIAKRFSV